MTNGIVVAALIVLVIVAIAGWIVAGLLAYRGPMVIYVPDGARLALTTAGAGSLSHVRTEPTQRARRDPPAAPAPPPVRAHPSFPRGAAGRVAVEQFAARRMEERRREEQAAMPFGDEDGDGMDMQDPATVETHRDPRVNPTAPTPVGGPLRRHTPPARVQTREDTGELLEEV